MGNCKRAFFQTLTSGDVAVSVFDKQSTASCGSYTIKKDGSIVNNFESKRIIINKELLEK